MLAQLKKRNAVLEEKLDKQYRVLPGNVPHKLEVNSVLEALPDYRRKQLHQYGDNTGDSQRNRLYS